MDKDLEKSLKDLICKSHQPARQSGELAAKSKVLIEHVSCSMYAVRTTLYTE